jgi:hypothetical protein
MADPRRRSIPSRRLCSGSQRNACSKPLATESRLAYNPGNMANLYYNDHLIIAFTTQNHSDKQWTAGAEITWKQDGERRSHTLGGLTERFKNGDDAEKYIVNLAKAWIDANS